MQLFCVNQHYYVILLIGLSTVKSACEVFRLIQEVLLMSIEVCTAGPSAFKYFCMLKTLGTLGLFADCVYWTMLPPWNMEYDIRIGNLRHEKMSLKASPLTLEACTIKRLLKSSCSCSLTPGNKVSGAPGDSCKHTPLFFNSAQTGQQDKLV